jgi:hypothetical protein
MHTSWKVSPHLRLQVPSIVSFPSRCHLTLRDTWEQVVPVQAPPLASRMSLSYKPNWGQWEMEKRQQRKDQTCIKRGPGRLCARTETHQLPPPLVSLLYTTATWGREAFLWEGSMTSESSGTGETCDSVSLNVNILGKNSCTASCPLLQLRLCQLKHAIYWA